jgi:hypothetical protein
VAVPEPTPDPVTVTHALVVVAVHAQVGCVVTAIDPLEPVGGDVISDGETAKVQVAVACVTVNDFPAIVSVADRDRLPVLGATAKVTVLDPVPVAPPEIVTHGMRLEAVQLQPDVVVTVTVPLPPPGSNAWLVGEIVKAHAVVAGWITANDLPAMVIDPTRDVVPVFCATE